MGGKRRGRRRGEEDRLGGRRRWEGGMGWEEQKVDQIEEEYSIRYNNKNSNKNNIIYYNNT